MGLLSPKRHEYLTANERSEIEKAFVDAGIKYHTSTRERLMDGINREYRPRLPEFENDPAKQLSNDLMLMNRVEKLKDATVPLEQWLRNAAGFLRAIPEGAVIEEKLRKVASEADTTRPALMKEETPATDFEEIITDDIDDLQDVSFLQIGAERLPAVVKLLVPRYANGQPVLLKNNTLHQGAGTAWLVTKDLLFTNFHVIRNRRQDIEATPSDADLKIQAENASAHFQYDTENDVGFNVPVSRLIALGREKTADFALLRLAESVDVTPLPLLAEKVELRAPQQTPKGTALRPLAVNIIQHPGGGPKRVALRNNLVYKADYPRLHYFTDTLSGSSGSPVFDDTWRVVALHRATVPERTVLNGREIGYVNEGIQIHAILAALATLAQTEPDVQTALQEICTVQNLPLPPAV